jgi:hypothetical protein
MSSVLNMSEVALVLIMSEPGGGVARSRIQEIFHPRHPHGIVYIKIFFWWYIKIMSTGVVGPAVRSSLIVFSCLVS